MDFIEIIQSRRSCRKFQSQAIPKHHLDIIMKSAVCSPTACNRQDWRFKVCCDNIINNELSTAILQRIPDVLLPKSTKDYADPVFYNAPCVIYIFLDRVSDDWIKLHNFDVGFASMSMILTAKGLGYDSVPVALASFGEPEITARFGNNGEVFCGLCLCIGKSDDDDVVFQKKDLSFPVQFF
eukprot:TRINITY_DN2394_c0_g1_i1.p1 TRINITY_DN2394_c0_g1~~TRINITY_DN2394_c0_g1_i1.p1  ORF type:complete len:182 (+),score=40.34 TRINITY_DN2394_c0_g1_i1:185-730(+)